MRYFEATEGATTVMATNASVLQDVNDSMSHSLLRYNSTRVMSKAKSLAVKTLFLMRSEAASKHDKTHSCFQPLEDPGNSQSSRLVSFGAQLHHQWFPFPQIFVHFFLLLPNDFDQRSSLVLWTGKDWIDISIISNWRGFHVCFHEEDVFVPFNFKLQFRLTSFERRLSRVCPKKRQQFRTSLDVFFMWSSMPFMTSR